MDPRRDHWERVYTEKAPSTVSWFQVQAAPSLEMIKSTGLGFQASIIDVGSGASALVDGLLDEGFHNIAALDVSSQALALSQARLGERQAKVHWIVTDITAWRPPTEAFDLWHDRAVFHFLTEEADRRAYLWALGQSLRAGGYVILAPFSLTGPERCSGLTVQRYSAETLQAVLGSGFKLLTSRSETHLTPNGSSQAFVWCLFQKG